MDKSHLYSNGCESMHVCKRRAQTSCVRQRICTVLAIRTLRIIIYLLLRFVFNSFSSTLCKIQSKTEVYQTTSVPLFFWNRTPPLICLNFITPDRFFTFYFFSKLNTTDFWVCCTVGYYFTYYGIHDTPAGPDNS